MNTIKKDALTAFIIQGIGAVVALSIQVILARLTTVPEYGSLSYFFTITNIFVVILSSGAAGVILKYGPVNYKKKKQDEIKKIFNFSLKYFFSTFLFLFCIVIMISILDHSHITLYLGAFLASIFLGILTISSRFFRAMGKIFISQSALLVYKNIFLLIVLLLCIYYGYHLDSFSAMLLIIINYVFVATYWFIKVPKNGETGIFSKNILYKSTENYNSYSFSFLLITFCTILFVNLDILLIKWLYDFKIVAIYSVASKLIFVSEFGYQAVNVALTNKISIYIHEKNLQNVSLLAQNASRIITLYTLVVSFLLYFFGEEILLFFGASYREAYPILLIMLFTRIISGLFGVVQLIANMVNLEKMSIFLFFSIILIEPALAKVLIIYFGYIGIAYAVLLGYFFYYSTLAVIVFKKTKIRCFVV